MAQYLYGTVRNIPKVADRRWYQVQAHSSGLGLGKGEFERLHNGVGKQLLACLAGHFLCFILAGSFHMQGDVLTYPHIVQVVEAQVVQAVVHGLALGVQQFFVRHYVDMCYVLHNKSKVKSQNLKVCFLVKKIIAVALFLLPEIYK